MSAIRRKRSKETERPIVRALLSAVGLNEMLWIEHIKHSFRATFYARASEWALAVILLNCAAVLLINESMFADDYRSLYLLASLADQLTWGVTLIVTASLRLCVLAINGLWRRSPHLRALCAFFSCLFWFLLSYGILQAQPYTWLSAIFPVLLLLDSYNTIRALGEGAEADVIHEKKQDVGHAFNSV